MARAKRSYILIIKVNKLFSFFSSWCFLKETENMYSVFLLSYRNTRETLGELEKAVETLTCSLCSHSISCSPRLPLVFLYRRGSRGGEMGEFSPPPPFSEPPFSFSFFYHPNQALVLLNYYKNSPPISKSWIRACYNSIETRYMFSIS